MRTLSKMHTSNNITALATIGCRINIVVWKVVVDELRLWRHLVHDDVSDSILDVIVLRIKLSGLGRRTLVASPLG